jgi:hypothetical protein
MGIQSRRVGFGPGGRWASPLAMRSAYTAAT